MKSQYHRKEQLDPQRVRQSVVRSLGLTLTRVPDQGTARHHRHEISQQYLSIGPQHVSRNHFPLPRPPGALAFRTREH